MSGDLSTRKETHMSVSLHGQTEFHFNNQDLKTDGKFKVGQVYTIPFRAVCTSVDEKDTRFRTVAMPTVVAGSAPAPVAPRKGTQKEAVRRPYSH